MESPIDAVEQLKKILEHLTEIPDMMRELEKRGPVHRSEQPRSLDVGFDEKGRALNLEIDC